MPASVGRYTLHGEIAAGGMATVYFGRLSGPIGFSRIVAIKRMHKRLSRDRQFVAMFVDEATLASRILHPNVVPIVDIVVEAGEICIVMDYVRGQSLAGLLNEAVQEGAPVPVSIAASIMAGVLAGLHAAHEARDKQGKPLSIVHRDVSPHNILVGVDGVARIMDFGVARASSRLHMSQEGQIVGKLSYMAPEQLRGKPLDRRADVFAAGVVLWGMLAGRRLFRGEDVTIMNDVIHAEIPPISSVRPDVPAALDEAIARALERDPDRRVATARQLAQALESACPMASASVVGAWVETLAATVLAKRESLIGLIENTGSVLSAEEMMLSASGPEAPSGSANEGHAGPSTGVTAITRAERATEEPIPDSIAPTRAWAPDGPTGLPPSSLVASVAAPAATSPAARPNSPALLGAVAGIGVLGAAGLALGIFALAGRNAAPPAPTVQTGASASAASTLPAPQQPATPDVPATSASVIAPASSAGVVAAERSASPVSAARPLPKQTGKGPHPKTPSKAPVDLGFIPPNNK